MKSKGKTLARATGMVLCAHALAACGGGGGPSQSAAPESSASVPAAASSSVAALIAWASNLPPSEIAQPLATASFTPPVDDSAAPLPVAM